MIELVLSLSDLGLIGPAYMRQLVYFNGAFWPGLLDNWLPNYAAQPYLMFLSYGFLHGGLMHLAVNMITLWSLGRWVLNESGWAGFVFLYACSSIGGAAGFALLAPDLRPMVGASGALFGLMGAILTWEYADQRSEGDGVSDVAKVVALLIFLNILLWWAMDGQLAWQAHLGGFLAGCVGGVLIRFVPTKTGQN